MINTLVATWRREGIDAWTRRHPAWSSLPWMLAMCGAGLSAIVALLVSGGSNTARYSALNTWCVVGLWPLLCYCVVGRRISFRFVRHLGATIELAEGMGRTVPEHRVWWREHAVVVALPATALTAATASGVAYATSSQGNLSELGWWLLVASAALWLAAFLALRGTRDRRELAFERAVWTDAETSADQRVVALREQLDAERAAERAYAEEIRRREAALAAAGIGEQIGELEKALLATSTSINHRRVRGLETQLASLASDLARSEEVTNGLATERSRLQARIEATERRIAEGVLTVAKFEAVVEHQNEQAVRAERRSILRDAAFFLAGLAVSILSYLAGLT